MLPMLITLPGPGSTVPSAIDVEVLQAAPVAGTKLLADPATTSALPVVINAPARFDGGAERAAQPATAQPSSSEVAPDDMPQQMTRPAASARMPLDLPVAEPLAPILVSAPALEPPAPEEVRPVMAGPDVATTSAIVLVDVHPGAEEPDEAAGETGTPPAPPTSEKAEPEPEPDVARADPKEEASPQASPAEDSAAADLPPSPPVAQPATRKKPAPQATPKVKAQAKAAPAATKKRPTATAKRTAPPSRRVVKSKPQAPMTQGIMSIFGGTRKPQAGAAANAAPRRPAAQR